MLYYYDYYSTILTILYLLFYSLFNENSILVCEDNLDPQLDQGDEEVIRVTLLTLVLTKLRANRLLNLEITYFT